MKHRYVLCWAGEGPDDTYDCACCMMAPGEQNDCGCVCHTRIASMASNPEIRLFLLAAVAMGVFPENKEPHWSNTSMTPLAPGDSVTQNVDGCMFHTTDEPITLQGVPEGLNFPARPCPSPGLTLGVHPPTITESAKGERFNANAIPYKYCSKCHEPECPWCFPNRAPNGERCPACGSVSFNIRGIFYGEFSEELGVNESVCTHQWHLKREKNLGRCV